MIFAKIEIRLQIPEDAEQVVQCDDARVVQMIDALDELDLGDKVRAIVVDALATCEELAGVTVEIKES